MTFEPHVAAFLSPYAEDHIDRHGAGGVLQLACDGNDVTGMADRRERGPH